MSQLERSDIQGMLLSAYGHLPWSANVLLRIVDGARARTWLGTLAASITPATGKHHHGGTNLAVSYAGLRKLGLNPPAGAFSPAFVDGMASLRRARILADYGPSTPEHWQWGAEPNAVDLLLMLFAPEQDALDAALGEQRAAFEAAGLAETTTLVAQRYDDGKEHFGFSDGIAQPAIRGEDRSEPARRRTNSANDVAAGEFILGYVNEYGIPSDVPQLPGAPDFGRNGSYLVLRQIEQDVAKFWQFVDGATRGADGTYAITAEQLAAKFLGRWPSGAPLVKAPLADDPRLAGDNDFGFAADLDGLLCPVGAHIRRANPRDGFAHDDPQQSVRRSNRHRILRRGRPYGTRLVDRFVDDGKARGLVFICLNSDIERQFEFVQQTWLNNTTFCGLTDEVDPLVGSASNTGVMTIPQDPIRRRVKGIERFVTTRGGAYFFLPGLRALRYIAALDPVAHS